METDKLKYFCTIAETGSLTKAADLLGISHSGLSKAISALQDELSVQLFQPQGRGLEITQEGKRIYQRAVEVLKVVDGLKLGVSVDTSAVTRIGLSEVMANSCARFLSEEIEGRLMITRSDAGELEGQILRGEIDFGMAFVPNPMPELEYLPIGSIRFAAFARKYLEGSVDMPFVGPNQGLEVNPLNFQHRDGWPHGLTRNLVYTAGSLAIALDLVLGGRCAIYMPAFIATKHQLVEVPAFKAARTDRKVFLVKTKNVAETAAMKKAAKVIRRHCMV